MNKDLRSSLASASSEGSDRQQHERLNRIYGRWNGSRKAILEPAYVSGVTLPPLVAVMLMSPGMLLDSALMGWDWTVGLVPEMSGGFVALALMVSSFVQGWILELRLRWRTVQPWSVRRRVLWPRFILSAVPVAGILLLPIWENLQRHKPSWAFAGRSGVSSSKTSGGAPLRVGKAWIFPFRLPPRWLVHPWTLVSAVILSLLTTTMWAAWLEVSSFPSRQAQLLTGLAFAHGFSFACNAFFLFQVSRWFPSTLAKIMPLSSLLSLLPIPFATLLGWILVSARYWRRQGTLVIRAMGQISQLAPAVNTGHPATEWLTLETRLRRSWEGQPWWRRLFGRRLKLAVAPSTESSGKVSFLASAKCLLLLPEGAALAYGLGWLQQRWPDFAASIDLALSVGFLAALISGILAAIAAGFRFIKRLTLAVHDRPPLARYLAAAHLSLVVGLLLGAMLHPSLGNAGEPLEEFSAAHGLLFFYASLWVLLALGRSLLFSILRVPKAYRGPESSFWASGFLLHWGVGFLTLQGESGEAELGFLRDACFLFVAVGLVLGLRLHSWVLRPWRLGDLMRRELSLRQRLELFFLATTTLLPLGGLAAPFWFRLRRSWPQNDSRELVSR